MRIQTLRAYLKERLPSNIKYKQIDQFISDNNIDNSFCVDPFDPKDSDLSALKLAREFFKGATNE
jgi:hypothetical protein